MAFIVTPESFAWVFQPLTRNGKPPIYMQNSLLNLTVSTLTIVAIATIASTPAGGGFGHSRHPAIRRRVPAVEPLARQYRPDFSACSGAGAGRAGTVLSAPRRRWWRCSSTACADLRERPYRAHHLARPVTEAARGRRDDRRQRLLGVELPLATPVILAGIRPLGGDLSGDGDYRLDRCGLDAGRGDHCRVAQQQPRLHRQGGLVVGVMAVLIYDAAFGARAGTDGPHRPASSAVVGADLSDFDLVLAGTVVAAIHGDRGWLCRRARRQWWCMSARGTPPHAHETALLGKALSCPDAIDATGPTR